MTDIAAIMDVVPADLIDNGIRTGSGIGNMVTECAHAEHATASGDDATSGIMRGSGVEHLAVHRRHGVKPVDRLPL